MAIIHRIGNRLKLAISIDKGSVAIPELENFDSATAISVILYHATYPNISKTLTPVAAGTTLNTDDATTVGTDWAGNYKLVVSWTKAGVPYVWNPEPITFTEDSTKVSSTSDNLVDDSVILQGAVYLVNKGAKGDKGDTGDIGDKGDKGDTGYKGDNGDAFVYEDFTPEQLAALQGEPAPERVVIVSGGETAFGTFDFLGENMIIYRRTFDLLDLPKLSESKEYIITTEPLGLNLFVSINSFVATTRKPNISDFVLDLYSVNRIYVDEDMQTVVVIKGNRNTDLNMHGTLTLYYVKFQGDIVDFTVTVPESIDPNDVELSIPVLKYDKDIVFSYINDDTKAIYNNNFCVVNKKPVSNEVNGDGDGFFWHSDMIAGQVGSGTEGSIMITPEKFLEYTDGAGVKHRFATSVAIWFDYLRDHGWSACPWTTIPEFILMADFGYTVNLHDLEHYIDGISQDDFNSCVVEDQNNIEALIGRKPKIMVEPNGNINYSNLGWGSPNIQMQVAQNNGTPYFPFTESLDKDERHLVFRDFWSGTD